MRQRKTRRERFETKVRQSDTRSVCAVRGCVYPSARYKDCAEERTRNGQGCKERKHTRQRARKEGEKERAECGRERETKETTQTHSSQIAAELQIDC